MPKIDGVVDVDHPSIVNSIRNMVRDGYSKETIMRTIGVDAVTVEGHQRRMESQLGTPVKAGYSDSDKREMLDRMAKMREKRKLKKEAKVGKALGVINPD
jgi:hypothetical protein